MDALNWTATQALKEMTSGRISSREYTEELLNQCAKLSDLNAFIHLDPEQALSAASAADAAQGGGVLKGLPIPVKDNFNTLNMPTTGGTPGLRGHCPRDNAEVVQSLLDAGGFVLGKLNMHELAYGVTNNNSASGPARNPYNRNYIPGGSSGGTGVAISAHMAPIGLGSDTGGSVRIPAALCGIAGFRPTLKRYSQTGIIPISNTRDTAGTLARSVEDLILLDGVITGNTDPVASISLKGTRIGVPRGYFYENLEVETARLAEEALSILREAGAVLVEADIERVGELDLAASFPVALYETVIELERYLQQSNINLDYAGLVKQTISPDVHELLNSLLTDEGAIPESAYQEALKQHRPALQSTVETYFRENNLVAAIFPTTPLPAVPIGQDETVQLNGEAVPTFQTFIHNTDPASNAGIPGLSVPAGVTQEGLPVGIELNGPAGSDRQLLALGLAIEQVLPPTPPPQY